MNKNLIINYIQKITKEDIQKYISKENIQHTKEEIDLIYKSIKNDYNEILNNFQNYITKQKNKLNPILYNKIIENYNKINKLFFSYHFNFIFIRRILILSISINIRTF